MDPCPSVGRQIEVSQDLSHLLGACQRDRHPLLSLLATILVHTSDSVRMRLSLVLWLSALGAASAFTPRLPWTTAVATHSLVDRDVCAWMGKGSAKKRSKKSKKCK
jgi:hypothetical protein